MFRCRNIYLRAGAGTMATDIAAVIANLASFYDFKNKSVVHVGAGGGQFIGYASDARPGGERRSMTADDTRAEPFRWAIVALVGSYVRATAFERAASGLNALVVCLVLGLAPMIPTAAHLVAPGVVFPGSDYYDLTWVLIPFALARSTVLQARSRAADTNPTTRMEDARGK